MENDQQQEPDRANPGDPVSPFSPETSPRNPEPAQQIALARLFDLFW